MNHDLTTHAGQIANIKAVRARIAAAAYRSKSNAKPKPLISSEWTKRPMWKQQDLQFDWHVLSFKVQDRTAPHIKWMKQRCVELEVTYGQMIGMRGSNEVAIVRMRMYSEMKEQFPELSYPSIAKAFGGRDHSSVHSGIRRWRAMQCE